MKVRELLKDGTVASDALAANYTVAKAADGDVANMRFTEDGGDGTELTAEEVAAKEGMSLEEFLDLEIETE